MYSVSLNGRSFVQALDVVCVDCRMFTCADPQAAKRTCGISDAFDCLFRLCHSFYGESPTLQDTGIAD